MSFWDKVLGIGKKAAIYAKDCIVAILKSQQFRDLLSSAEGVVVSGIFQSAQPLLNQGWSKADVREKVISDSMKSLQASGLTIGESIVRTIFELLVQKSKQGV